MELRGPLFRLLRRTQAAILDDLPKAFGLEEDALQRSDRPAIPQRALREALVNAMMHRSYRVDAPVQIIRYANRLEIRNPGFSLKAHEHLGEPGSMPRNPIIAAVLHETRFAETKGSGIRAIHEAMDTAGLAPPLFESDRGRDHFVTQFLFHHFLSEDDIAWLAGFRELQLTQEDARALVVVRESGMINNATYRSLNKVDVLTASGALRRLRDAGLLEQQGAGSATWYRPTVRLREGRTHEPERGSDILSSMSEPLSSMFEPLSSMSEPLSSMSQPTSDTHQTERDTLLDLLPGQLAARVGGIGLRHPPEQLRELVVELCQLQGWKVDELAVLLQRKSETVRQEYLRPLLARGRIVMTILDKPRSRQQAYRSVERDGE